MTPNACSSMGTVTQRNNTQSVAAIDLTSRALISAMGLVGYGQRPERLESSPSKLRPCSVPEPERPETTL
jgi:hypothetical protein